MEIDLATWVDYLIYYDSRQVLWTWRAIESKTVVLWQRE